MSHVRNNAHMVTENQTTEVFRSINHKGLFNYNFIVIIISCSCCGKIYEIRILTF